MSAFWNLFKKGNKAVLDIREEEIRFSSLNTQENNTCIKIKKDMCETLEGILAVKETSEVLISIRNKYVYSGIVNIGHFSMTDDLFEILRWRFFQEKELQPSEFELTYIPLFSKGSGEHNENYYYISVIRKDILKRILEIFESFHVKVKEILTPAYAISKAIHTKTGYRNFASISFSNRGVFISVFYDGNPVYLRDMDIPDSLGSENADEFIAFAKEIFYGVSNHLSEIYEKPVIPQHLYMDYEGKNLIDYDTAGYESIKKLFQVDFKFILNAAMKEIFKYE